MVLCLPRPSGGRELHPLRVQVTTPLQLTILTSASGHQQLVCCSARHQLVASLVVTLASNSFIVSI